MGALQIPQLGSCYEIPTEDASQFLDLVFALSEIWHIMFDMSMNPISPNNKNSLNKYFGEAKSIDDHNNRIDFIRELTVDTRQQLEYCASMIQDVITHQSTMLLRSNSFQKSKTISHLKSRHWWDEIQE
jgi:hypothetical protein